MKLRNILQGEKLNDRTKMCGGKLKLIDGFAHTTCEYCGSTRTLPDVNDKQR
mgnify:CR=1 FL=1